MHVLACLLPDSKNNFLHQRHMARLTPDWKYSQLSRKRLPLVHDKVVAYGM